MSEREKILIIDDAPEIGRFYNSVLTPSGFDVVIASDSAKGILIAETEHPHLIMLDLRLPDADGLQVLNALRSKETTKKIPIIVFTGSASKQKVDEALYLGADAFIFKGMMPIKQLVEKIRSLIASSKDPK